jgi:phage gp16-like protein
MTRSDPMRRVELAKIHLAKKQLSLDDATYRAIIARVAPRPGPPPQNGEGTGERSSAALLDARERRALLEEFRHLGWRDQPRDPDAPRASRVFHSPQARHIWKCWQDLAAAGALNDTSERALRRFVRGLAKTDHVEWLSSRDANVVIQALKSWHARVSAARKGTGL